MGDDDLRNRFRRDFTSEPIGGTRPQFPGPASIPKATPQPAPQPRPVFNPATVSRPQTVAAQPSPAPRPAVPAPQPGALSFEPAKLPPRKSKSRKKLIAIVILILIVLGGAAGYWYKFRLPTDPIPASIKSSVNYPLLYPSKLPPGYKIVASSFNSANDAVVFEADDQSSDKIAFSVQKRPPTFDFPSFYKQGLGNAALFSTDIGEAAVGTVASKPIGSLATDKSWMLVSSSSKNVTNSDIRLILNNIKQAN